MAESQMQSVETVLQPQPQNPDERLKTQKQFDSSIIKSFIPLAKRMTSSEAEKQMFLSDDDLEPKRQKLMSELKDWIRLMDECNEKQKDAESYCAEQITVNTQALRKGVEVALKATAPLEASYRELQVFFLNANCEKAYNLRVLNADDSEFTDNNKLLRLEEKVRNILHKEINELDKTKSYSFLALPGYRLKTKDDMRRWAKMSYDNNVMFITDAEDVKEKLLDENETMFERLCKNTENLKDTDPTFQNVIVTANWILGRDAESMSVKEVSEKGFFIPPSLALLGKLYNESLGMSQAPSGETYGTFLGAKGVKVDGLGEEEIAKLRENHVVPIVYSKDRVMAFGNSSLYNKKGDDMTEYSIVRVYLWVERVLQTYANSINGENWDPYNHPTDIQKVLQNFFNQYKGYGKAFQEIKVHRAQMPADNRVVITAEILPYYAMNYFKLEVKKMEDPDKKK